MSDAPQEPVPSEAAVRSDFLLRAPLGFTSPLWGYFAGAAVTGSAWWWMTRWTRIQNLEAMFGAAEARAVQAATLPLPAVEAVAEAAIQTLDAIDSAVDQVVEPAAEAATEAAVEAVAEAEALEAALSEATPEPILEALEPEAPVGGESAPISPVVAAIAPGAPAADAEAEASAEPEAPAAPRVRRKTKAE